jgi:hypothetical protein
MIRISCTNCKTILSIDDAFAGGVCRCQHCGTIQTVPSQARQTAQVGHAASKSLYQNDARSAGSGLDDLADIVVSSGLASSRLTKPPGAGGGSKNKQNLMPFIVGGTVVVALLLVVIVILLSRNSGPTPPTGSTVTSPNGSVVAPTLAANTPSFCGTRLDGNTIIYLLDCGSANQDLLGELKDATIKSIGSLGPDRKFQILFWNDGSGAYPEKTTTYATKENIDAAQKAIDDVTAFGQGEITTAIKSAMAQQPDVLIVATGKGWDLNSKWLDDIMAIRGSSPAKIDTYSLGSDDESAPLKKLASQTGGTYHQISHAELRTFGQ